MSKICDLCERVAMNSFTRSHSNIKTKHKQGVNLQSKKVSGMKLKLCTRCLRTVKKEYQA